MANFKVVVSDPKAKRAYQKEIEQGASGLAGKRIGDTFSGNHLGLGGYELEITGGSDKDGFPMRRDIEGPARKKVLLSHPPGFHPSTKGKRKRKSVRGNTVSPQISQINLKIVTYGAKNVEELFSVKAKEKEEKPKEPAAEKKPEHKAEKPAEEKHAEKKAEHKEHAEKPHPEKPAESKPAEHKTG